MNIFYHMTSMEIAQRRPKDSAQIHQTLFLLGGGVLGTRLIKISVLGEQCFARGYTLLTFYIAILHVIYHTHLTTCNDSCFFFVAS